ncbi:uncharacterized protein C2orf81-like [Myxocyprinus asiaticus]|uniref:uncharacterized protein C2orf81-like n=1 Tax=Myxocyprinus asiaticus TaxID=70543 RepID=UPI002223AFAB|nr:uncharacterized protein C2orf81-like [Myxocyprinus asiaticus]XP_051533542.1 uncharacterized protein C2orf81-like [Myxocyprinus asiaticus]
MPRSAAKSQAEKSRTDSGPVSAGPPPPLVQSVEAVDIVPGRLTESAWNSMLKQEEGEEIVADIIAELMEVVMDRCYQVYLQRQLIPFSVWWAQNNLVQTIECLFLGRDEGDDPECERYWQEDSEPQPCAIDSWAEGCVPVVHQKLAQK